MPAPPPRRAAIAIALLVWTELVTVARTVRWPNDFAEAHWLLDYRFGLVKRGLAGEVLSVVLWPFGLAADERLVDALGMATFAGLSVVLLVLAVRIARSADWSASSMLAALAFLSSPYVVMAAHLTGYFDHILVLLTVAAVVLLGRDRVWAAAAVLGAAVLVHESALVFGFPVLVVAWLVARDGARIAGRSGPSFWPLALPVAAFLFLMLSPGFLLAPDFQDAFTRRLEGFGFIGGDMHLFVPEWLAPGGLAALTAQSHRFVERTVFAEAYGLVLPTTLGLFGYLVDRHGRGQASPAMAAVALAILAPIVMHLAAWDTIRIWTYSIGTAWLALWVYARAASPVSTVSGAARWTAAAAVAVNVLVMTPLYDGLTDRLALTTRLLLYAPVLAAVVVLIRSGDGDADTSGTIERS